MTQRDWLELVAIEHAVGKLRYFWVHSSLMNQMTHYRWVLGEVVVIQSFEQQFVLALLQSYGRQLLMVAYEDESLGIGEQLDELLVENL